MSEALYTCPKCNDVLKRFHVENVEVDKCPSCDGIWLDAGELVKLKLAPNKQGLLERDKKEGGRKAPPSAGHLQLGCPACDGKMKPLALQPKVILDHCGSCGGLWLDHKELRSALDAISGAGGGVSAKIIDALLGVARG